MRLKMEISQTVNLYITYIENEGPFLKVWGQIEKNNSVYVEQFLLGASPQFDSGVGRILDLQAGSLVCAKYKDSKYYRARILNTSFMDEGFVEVSFIDYGNRDVVPCSNIRSLQNFPSSFISVPPLATGFIFAEAHCPGGGEWSNIILENISKEIKYREVQCTIVTQATQFYLVKLYIGGNDLGALLINRGLLQPISLQAQQAVLLSMSMQRSLLASKTSAPPPTTTLNTYKASALEPGCQYPVYVSYVNDGPCHFSVQLKQSEDGLVKLMNEINRLPLRLLEDIPIPGTICLARCQEDSNICRAVVTNEVDNQFKVFYVDFGNYEVVPLDSLYQIPFKYVLPKVMAIRYSLSGVEKSTVTLEMQCAFKQFVDNRLLYMKVLPTSTRVAIPKCELWDAETKTSALDVVNRAAKNAYPEPVSLNRGFSQLVKVSYVYSCSRFYVQLSSKENELLKLMLDLQAICQTNDFMDPSNIKEGLPCCALFESDQQWYRSQVVEVLGDNVKVRYIDYGNEEEVPSSQLKIIDGEQLTVLRPQAIECCLNGYQNMEQDLQRDGFLEELILERQFTMKVIEMTNKKALVELFDDSNYNIASLLLDKLASAKSQVSPMLVQAGNKIEHRKSFSNQNGPREPNFRQDHKPGRTNDRNDNSWRETKKDFRSNDRNFNENNNEKTPWREANKGFSPNSERFNNKDRNRGRNEWHNKENVSANTWETENNAPQENDDWGTQPTNTGFQSNSRENEFNRNKGARFNKDNWNSGGPKSGGFRKKNDFRKDGSDVSSSGSEQSFQKGPRTSSRADRPSYKKYDKPRNASFANNTDTNDSWNVSSVSSAIDAAPATATFARNDVVEVVFDVILTWFHTPCHFYCQLVDNKGQLNNLMSEIQLFYKGRNPESAVVGAPVIALFPEDNVLYRALVLEVSGDKYKVYYVDFGNIDNTTKVWPVEKKFMNMPAQAMAFSLNEIAPPGDQWPSTDNVYSKYFDKEKYTCKFINKDEEKHYVDLFYGNDDIRQLMIQEGLAVSTQKIIPDIEIPLLLGQQFRAIVKSVNNLSDIIIALECGVALSCKMHNLEEAATTDDNNLKRFLERTVIIYVDNVIDDKLEVTLYDTEGSKIEVVSPDEGACDMVELPCPILILRSTLTGFVTHADELSVFVQPTEYSETVATLLDQMYEAYENLTQDVTILPEVELLYAARSEDGNWYRAKVINITDTQALVSYIDYGNTEEIDFDKLRQLSDKFLDVYILCIQVFVAVPSDSLIDKDVIANIFYGENGWEGTVEMSMPTESSSTESAAADKIEGQQVSVSENIIEPVEVTEQMKLPLNDAQEASQPETAAYVGAAAEDIVQNGIQVVVSHIDSPNEFYLQLTDSLSAIEELQLNLQQQAPEMPVLETPTAGILCTAPFSVDQQWYRAEVLDADDDITTVRFVDYGNTDVISNETTEIKTLPPNLLSLAVYATRSSLKVRSVDGEWSTAAIERFETLLGDSNVTAEFINQDEKTNYIELYANGQNVKDILINENLAIPTELSEESKSTCFVSHLNSPSEFWLQLENCVDELEWIAEQLSGAENFPELEDTTPGTLCAALFPDDQMWYRARILSNTVAGLELLFIDYGNSSLSSSLRQLPEDLVVTSPLAQKCSLQKPDGIPCWSPQAAKKFSEISADGQTIFTVHKISTGETSIVQLLIDGEDVMTMLLPETEVGYVKNIEDLSSFEIEKNGEVLPESYGLEPLPGMTWTKEANDKFTELNNQGTKLFQIEFLPELTVRLYVDGSDIRPDLGGVKISALNISRTSSAEEDKTENEIDINGYLNDTIPNEELEETYEAVNSGNEGESVNDKAIKVIYPQSSSEDIKHILGLRTSENDSSKKETEETEREISTDSDTKTISEELKDVCQTLTETSETGKYVPCNTEAKTRFDEIKEACQKLIEAPESEIYILPDIITSATPEEIEEACQKLLETPKTEKDISTSSKTETSSNEMKKEACQELRESPESKKGVSHDSKMKTGSEEIEKDADQKFTEPLHSDSDVLHDSETQASSEEIKIEVRQKLIEAAAPEKDFSPNIERTSKEIEEAGQKLTERPKSEKDISPSSETGQTSEEIEEVCQKSAERLETEKNMSPGSETKTESEDIKKEICQQLIEALDIEEAYQKLTQRPETDEEIYVDTEIKTPEETKKEDCQKLTETEKDVAHGSKANTESKEIEKETCQKLTETSESGKDVSLDSETNATSEELEETPKSPEKQKLIIKSNLSSENLSESEVAEILKDAVDNALAKKGAEVRSRPVSSCSGKISHDERIVPAVASRPHSPIQDEGDKSENQVKSRPPSSCSGKISHDERIVPAVLSRPQSPIPRSDDTDSQETKDEK